MDFQPKKIFTPAEARQTLPLVRRIVNDILNLSYEINSLSALLGDDASAAEAGPPPALNVGDDAFRSSLRLDFDA